MRLDTSLGRSNSVDYLVYSGFVMMAYFWALQAAKAAELLASVKGKESVEFYTAKRSHRGGLRAPAQISGARATVVG